MNGWLLQIEIAGEWEECTYPTQAEALDAFAAVAADYPLTLSRAVLVAREIKIFPLGINRATAPTYIN